MNYTVIQGSYYNSNMSDIATALIKPKTRVLIKISNEQSYQTTCDLYSN